jgi:hypothetical protein
MVPRSISGTPKEDPEGGVLGDHAHIGPQRELHAAGDRKSLDCGNHGFRQPQAARPHRRNRIVAADLALLVGIARCHRLEVGARAEIAAGAGEHRDRRRCVGIEREKGIVEFARGRAVHGVPAMRSVDGNDGDGAVALDKDSISFRHGCAPCLLFWE